jgi:eukaryotic-like serine/threonine-protein kinase
MGTDDSDATPLIRGGAQLASAAELAPGDPLDHYVVEARRGGGGFATVYRARDQRTGERVALKILHPQLTRTPKMRERFKREAETIALLDHPNIVRLLGFGESGSTLYLVMEWVDGATLAEQLHATGPFTLEETLRVVKSLAAALAAAHARGVVHRDLKVGNVALDAEGEVKLFDFGVAKLLLPEPHGGLTTAGTTLGTPHYMAPEQVLGETIDHRVDIYALGILVFELLTGRRPFDGSGHLEVEERQLTEPPPPISRWAAVPPAVDAVIQRAMSKQADRRQPVVTELFAELAEAARGTAPSVRRPGVALYVHAAPKREDVDDDVLDQLDHSLRQIRQQAVAAGLTVESEAVGSLLFVAVPNSLADREALVDRAEQIARGATADVHPDLVLALTVHVDDVEHDGTRYTRGPLLDLATWTRSSESGVFVTPSARR